jgi:hypothetical protein
MKPLILYHAHRTDGADCFGVDIISEQNEKELFPECTCGEEYAETHVCPYEQEVNDNDEDYCTCCDFCTENCRRCV